MSYCVERTRLLALAGRNLAAELLPKAFALWFSSHDTGCQMKIVTAIEGKPQLTVWQGSIWYSHCFEFNDRDDIPGLQPQFGFARETIDRYFKSLAQAVAARDVDQAIAKAMASAKRDIEQRNTVDALRRAIAGD